MNKKYFEDEAKSVIVQKHQLNKALKKAVELNVVSNKLSLSQKQDSDTLDELLLQMQNITNSTKDLEIYSQNFELSTLDESINKNDIEFIDTIEQIDFNKNISWSEYVKSVEEYAKKNEINLKDDPFRNLMSNSQLLELQKRIKEDFTYKKANCDKYDYMIAVACGAIGGLIDILFVGVPKKESKLGVSNESKLGNFVDNQANKITMKFAEMLGWDRQKAEDNNKNVLNSAIGYLEDRYKINYDQKTTAETGGKVKNLSLKNHHLKSLGHAPDIIGLFFSILNQFTSTSTFVSNGQLITIDTETFELKGNNFIAKIFCGFCNWFGHLMSDWTGSSGASGRGSGVPIPFYELTQLLNFGRFGEKHQQTFAVICAKVFEDGYDFRYGIAMAIPVLITELLTRAMYAIKAVFYHNKDPKDCIVTSSPELRRMLLVSHGTLCLLDGVDAGVRSGGNLVNFLLRTNFIAWVRFGHLALKEIYSWYRAGEIDPEKVDEYMEKEGLIEINKFDKY